MKAEIKGKELIITLTLEQPPQASASGKSLVIATTKGNQESELKIDNKPVIIGVNAYIKR
jgi:hypothetical protein